MDGRPIEGTVQIGDTLTRVQGVALTRSAFFWSNLSHKNQVNNSLILQWYFVAMVAYTVILQTREAIMIATLTT
jgi:hypothetical protein